MIILYKLSVFFYNLMIYIASAFNNKAKKWVVGRKNWEQKLKDSKIQKHNPIWFHCASLGEFEQGRPVLEKIKEQSGKKIVVSFFSPSGYEIRKNYENADLITYLPIDTKKNAKKFIELINPSAAFFIKYEFWNYYLKELHKKDIKTFLVAGNFRENQIFFKSYGAFYRKILTYFTKIFVQNKRSQELLKAININNVIITGDTRYDRVYQTLKTNEDIDCIKNIINNRKIFIAGSTWKKDEEIITEYINNCKEDILFIIAPHEPGENNVKRIQSSINKKSVNYTDIKNQKQSADVVIINTIGVLSRLYKYATIAYVGGAFGTGLHNILEPAVFSNPVIFGPNYDKYDEAKEMISAGCATSISNYNEFKTITDKLINDENILNKYSENASNFISSQLGAVDKTLARTEI